MFSTEWAQTLAQDWLELDFDIFISYRQGSRTLKDGTIAESDRVLAQKVYHSTRAIDSSVNVFLDTEKMPAGQVSLTNPRKDGINTRETVHSDSVILAGSARQDVSRAVQNAQYVSRSPFVYMYSQCNLYYAVRMYGFAGIDTVFAWLPHSCRMCVQIV